MLNATTKATLKLFNRAPDPQDSPDKEYPVMSGFLENKDFRLNVGAFLATDKSGNYAKDKNGNHMLSLSIGNGGEDDETFYGVLFKEVKPGKKNTYFGFITKSEDTGTLDEKQQKVYRTVWQLSLSGKQFVPAEEGKKRYIGCDVYPKKSAQTTEGAVEDSEELLF